MIYKRLFCASGSLVALIAIGGYSLGRYCWSEYTASSSLARLQGKEAPQFDCFSRPAIAAAILQQEADRCLLEYERARDLKNRIAQQHLAAGDLAGSKSQFDLSSRLNDARRLNASSNQMVALIRNLEDLDRSVTNLKNDLDRKLMLVDFENNLSNEFLNCYLNQLQAAPDGNAVVWGRYALECSRACSRKAEVLDAMRHLLQFRGEIKGVKGLQTLLDDWTSPGHLRQNDTPQ